VRQSAFALVGDLSRVCAPHLQPVMKQLLALAIQNMESHCIILQNMSACNNACWSMGKKLSCTLWCEAVTQCGVSSCIGLRGVSACNNACWSMGEAVCTVISPNATSHALPAVSPRLIAACLPASPCSTFLHITTPAGLLNTSHRAHHRRTGATPSGGHQD